MVPSVDFSLTRSYHQPKDVEGGCVAFCLFVYFAIRCYFQNSLSLFSLKLAGLGSRITGLYFSSLLRDISSPPPLWAHCALSQSPVLSPDLLSSPDFTSIPTHLKCGPKRDGLQMQNTHWILKVLHENKKKYKYLHYFFIMITYQKDNILDI